MLKEIADFQPRNEQEEVDQRLMLQFKDQKALLNRDNLAAHYTSSSFILNEDLTKVLFAHHNIYNSYGFSGGHNDGDEDFYHVAVKEAGEELGVFHLSPMSKEIQSLDCIFVAHHIKHGRYVSDHLHFNATYLFIGSENEDIRNKPDENSSVAWLPVDRLEDYVTEPHMMIIYNKLLKYSHQF